MMREEFNNAYLVSLHLKQHGVCTLTDKEVKRALPCIDQRIREFLGENPHATHWQNIVAGYPEYSRIVFDMHYFGQNLKPEYIVVVKEMHKK